MYVAFRFPYSESIVKRFAKAFEEIQEQWTVPDDYEYITKEDILKAFKGSRQVKEVSGHDYYGAHIEARKNIMRYMTSTGNEWVLTKHTYNGKPMLFLDYDGSRHGFWSSKNIFGIKVVKKGNRAFIKIGNVKGVLHDYYTSTPKSWGLKWYHKFFRDNYTLNATGSSWDKMITQVGFRVYDPFKKKTILARGKIHNNPPYIYKKPIPETKKVKKTNRKKKVRV